MQWDFPFLIHSSCLVSQSIKIKIVTAISVTVLGGLKPGQFQKDLFL